MSKRTLPRYMAVSLWLEGGFVGQPGFLVGDTALVGFLLLAGGLTLGRLAGIKDDSSGGSRARQRGDRFGTDYQPETCGVRRQPVQLYRVATGAPFRNSHCGIGAHSGRLAPCRR